MRVRLLARSRRSIATPSVFLQISFLTPSSDAILARPGRRQLGIRFLKVCSAMAYQIFDAAFATVVGQFVDMLAFCLLLLFSGALPASHASRERIFCGESVRRVASSILLRCNCGLVFPVSCCDKIAPTRRVGATQRTNSPHDDRSSYVSCVLSRKTDLAEALRPPTP